MCTKKYSTNIHDKETTVNRGKGYPTISRVSHVLHLTSNCKWIRDDGEAKRVREKHVTLSACLIWFDKKCYGNLSR